MQGISDSDLWFKLVNFFCSLWLSSFKEQVVDDMFVARAGATTSLRNLQQTGIDAARDVPTRQEQRNNRESKSAQYLTRFGNLPASSGRGEEILLIQQSIQTNTRGIL